MIRKLIISFIVLALLTGCSKKPEPTPTPVEEPENVVEPEIDEPVIEVEDGDYVVISPGVKATVKSLYRDSNGDEAVIPAQFMVSTKLSEQTIKTGLVVIAPDGNEFVWVPTTETKLAQVDFGSYFYGSGIDGYQDETSLPAYKSMIASVEKFHGFYMGRYEASCGGGKDLDSYIVSCKKVTEDTGNKVWVNFSPQDFTIACENMYKDNNSVQGFFPWGINWDTMLQWFIDSGNKTALEVSANSTSWGNYSNDSFSLNANGKYTGKWDEAMANNIYDVAGNNWEWTQERYGSNYVMRGGGYSLMGGGCEGSLYPAAIRDPLPGNNHHPNVSFRPALFLK